MSARPVPAAGLVMAGGGSRRMGRDKLSLPWGEGTLMSRIAVVMASTVAETWIVGSPETFPPTGCAGVGMVSDEPQIGPLGGLRAGLEAMAAPAALVVAADMPFVDPEAIRRLWQLAAGAPVTVLQAEDGAHPLLGVYRRECLPAIRRAIELGRRRMTSFWDDLPVRIVDVRGDPFWIRALFNVNTPADYRLALRLQAEATGPGESPPALGDPHYPL